MAIALRHPQVNWNISVAGELHLVLEREVRCPVLLGQAIDADFAIESSRIEPHDIIGESAEIHVAGNDIGAHTQSAATFLLKPQVDAGHVAGSPRSECRHRAGTPPAHLPLGIEEIDRCKTHDAISLNRKLALPNGFAAAAAIFRALPEHANAAA